MIQAGLVAETKKLLETGVSKRKIREFGFEYRAVLEYLWGKISKKGLHEKIVLDSLDYARRQMVWFIRNKEINWTDNPLKIEKLVKKFLTGVKNYGKK